MVTRQLSGVDLGSDTNVRRLGRRGLNGGIGWSKVKWRFFADIGAWS